MSWRLRLGQLFGIKLYVHVTFLLLLGWVGLAALARGQNLAGALFGILSILLVFACVVLHELGHALTARSYGIRTQDITLLPIGGVARLERMPRDPLQEFWVALAGPAVNVAIAALLLLLIAISQGPQALGGIRLFDGSMTRGSLLQELLRVNVLLVLFNLLPAFPMDGGRVLRALLAQKMDYVLATRLAANVGQLMAFVFAFVGLFYNPFLLFIALFVYMGAEAEAQAVQVQATFRGIPVRRAMVTQFSSLDSNDPLSRAVQVLLTGTQQDFPVTADGHVAGLLTRRDLLAALHDHGPAVPVAEAMRTDVNPIEASEALDEAFQRMQTEELPAAPVTDAGRLVGMLTMENIAEFLMVSAALEGAPMRASAGTANSARDLTASDVREPGVWRPTRSRQL